jgi:hypothetical protein
VPLERALRVRFDRFLRPTSVLRQSVLVTAGALDPDSGQPLAGSYFFEPRWDPYERVATFALQRGARWVVSTLHTAVVRPPSEGSGVAGIRAFDDAPLGQPLWFEFTTGETVTDPGHDVDDAWPRVSYCEPVSGPPRLPAIRSVLGASCALAACHAPPGPAFGMDLSSAAAIRATALRVVAHQTVSSSAAGQPFVNPERFGENMARIDPGNPGDSYLLYKLLVNLGNYPAWNDPENGEAGWQTGLPPPSPPSGDEVERLRAAFVRLSPMPLGGTLKVSAMRALVAWIAQGASMPATECR